MEDDAPCESFHSIGCECVSVDKNSLRLDPTRGHEEDIFKP